MITIQCDGCLKNFDERSALKARQTVRYGKAATTSSELCGECRESLVKNLDALTTGELAQVLDVHATVVATEPDAHEDPGDEAPAEATG